MRSKLLAGLIMPALIAGAIPVWAAAPAATLDRARAAMVVDPHKVVALVAQARRELASAPGDVAGERIRADWLEAEALGRLGELDRALTISARALADAERLQPGTKLHGDILMTQGAIALDQNRVREAFTLLRRAHAIFAKLGETRSQAIALQNIGTIYSFAGDQRSVLRYYAQAAEVHADDPALLQAAANNLGLAYRELGEYDRAEAQFRTALKLARTLESPVLEVRVWNNLAAVALLQKRYVEAIRFADRGLAAASDSDTAEWRPFLWGVKAQVALARGDVPQAVALFDRTFAGVELAKTNFYFRDFHASAMKAFEASGDMPRALQHMAAFKRLDDEAREIRSSTNAALAAAQFDFSTQELRIARLRQGQLQRDIAIERARAHQQLLLLLGALALAIVSTAAFFWIRRSRNETRVANRQLETTNTALDKALKAKSEFLATTSHEIRTPLNGILGMTQVIMQRRDLDRGVRDQVRLIDSAGSTMRAIVDDILDMAQIEQGRVQVERSDVALPGLIEDVAGLWRAAAERKGLTFEVDLTDAPAMIEEDERKLRQIGFNLLSNAVKFTAAGTIRVRAAADGDRLVLAITDTGIGIAPAQHEAIFEPFQQADNSTARQFGGTGLGLAISRKLAQALDGDISVVSALGEGSVFTLSLPLRVIDAPAGRMAGGDGTVSSVADACVFVVEPNPLFAAMIEACLGEAAKVVMVDEVAEVTDAADVIVVDEEASVDKIARLRSIAPNALIVVLGDAAGDADGAVARTMPPLHLPAALDELLAQPREMPLARLAAA
ncbi:ATP-binding protein [Sphingomonas radiodurans]|uniref:ATP-binding protein n=1 Tax=Sphingomonas radiodurans TaxID=2890321 RepID=UPI001E52AC51|nr:ATP-binding protein [Sphingomonas radiodurans]WBH14985.1 ATP-binding protein [Sphingomonas radiodurans]